MDIQVSTEQPEFRRPTMPQRSRRHGGQGACGKCHWCDRAVYPAGSSAVIADPSSLRTKDHHTPHSITKGASLPVSKTVDACQRCNNLKGDTPPEVFEFFIAQTDMSQPASKLVKEYRRFCYLLTATGFKAASAMAAAAPGRPIDLPNFLRPPKGPAPIPTARGSFTKADLRRGAK